MLRPLQEKDRKRYALLQQEVWITLNALDESIEEKNWKEAIALAEYTYAIADENDDFIGHCYGKHMDRKVPELAIEIMQAFQGQGIGKIALSELLERLYEETGKTQYEARVFPDNYPCLGLMRSCSAVPAGVELHPILVGEDVEEFRNNNTELIDSDLKQVAEIFQTDVEGLPGNVLRFRLSYPFQKEKDSFILNIHKEYSKAHEKAIMRWELQSFEKEMAEIEMLMPQEVTEESKKRHDEIIEKLKQKASYVRDY